MTTSNYIAVRVDDENNAETFWDALRAQFPALAQALARDSAAIVDRDLWDALTALPGWDDGPEYAPTALLDLGSEGDGWADVVAGRHGVFGPDGLPV